MGKNAIFVWLSAMAMMLAASGASGSIMVTGGTLHTFVTSAIIGTDAPPDKPFVSPMSSAGAQFGQLSAQETVSFTGGQVGISVRTFWLNQATATASGSLNITEDSSEPMWIRINPGVSGPYYLASVSMDAVGGGNVFSRSFGASSALPPFNFVAPLSPGQYTLTWNTNGQILAGTVGAGGFDFTMGVPEPSCLMLATLGAAMLLLRRRRSARF